MNASDDGGKKETANGNDHTEVPSAQDDPDFFNLSLLLTWMGGFLLVALLALVTLFSSGLSQSVAMLIWAFGLCAIGAIVGFLFGIPRVVAGTVIPDPTGYRLVANTNLEQVSDWLTKIIVGVGLVELKIIPEQVRTLAVFMSPNFGASPQNVGVATASILLFSAGGFLIGYVTTRAFLPHILRAIEGI